MVESVKAAADIYAPISGEVVAANGELAERPEKINQDAVRGVDVQAQTEQPGGTRRAARRGGVPEAGRREHDVTDDCGASHACRAALGDATLVRDSHSRLALTLSLTPMPFIPHTEDDVRAMLAAIGAGVHRGRCSTRFRRSCAATRLTAGAARR